MTPQEKAKELVDKFMPFTWSGASFIGIVEVEMMRNNPKECALIAVDYIVRTCHYEAQEEWQQVKEEIQKL